MGFILSVLGAVRGFQEEFWMAASNFDFNRLLLAVVPGKDSREYWQRQGDHFGGQCNHLGERFWQRRQE